LSASLSPDFFLQKAEILPVIDVRSPAEFAAGHIPGAINLPLFSDEERVQVGTIYKQQGPEKAVLQGLAFTGPKMAGFAAEGLRLARNGEILVHCWRGGMRSGSMAWLFKTAGIKASILSGGYKAYRHHVLDSFSRPLKLRIIGGETGSGKTEILQAIGRMGEQIIDLEALANHRGSSFGALGQADQPTPEHFENRLHRAISTIDPARPLWIEDESRSIGRVYIPAPVWEMKEVAPVYRIRMPFEVRVQRLVKDYGNFPREMLEEAVLRIRKRLGGLATQQAVNALSEGNLEETARITLNYYDKAYNFPHSDRKYEGVHFIDSETGDPEVNAKLVLKYVADQAHV
jgi:tRNA 2-selenouridine synthase